MSKVNRLELSKTERRELWHRWNAMQGLNVIGRALTRHVGAVYGFLSISCGIRPRYRKRSLRNLQLSEREEIFKALGQGLDFPATSISATSTKS